MSVTLTNRRTGKKFKKTEEEADRIKNSSLGKNYSIEKPAAKPAELASDKKSDSKSADKTTAAANGGDATTK